LVEHATENRSVGGSIPPLGTIPHSVIRTAMAITASDRCGGDCKYARVMRNDPLQKLHAATFACIFRYRLQVAIFYELLAGDELKQYLLNAHYFAPNFSDR
jgi:hypothetical protein